jgi:hypothetical protein
MQEKLQTIGYVLIGTLAGVILTLVYVWYEGGSVRPSGQARDGRVVVKVASAGAQGKYGKNDLQPGDRIVKINGIEISGGSEAYKILQALCLAPSEMIPVEVQRRDDDGKIVTLDGPVKLARDNIRTVVLAGTTKKKVNCDSTPASAETLFDAADSGNTIAVRSILELGGKKNDIIDELVEGETPLIAAVSGGHVSVVRELVAHGANVNKPAEDGTAPLMKAAELGNLEVVGMLLAAGADSGVRNNELKTAADIADTNGFLEVANFIDNPSPTKLLNADQRLKAVDKLSAMGMLKTEGYRATDPEIGRAIKEYQKNFGLPESGLLTPDSFGDLVKDAKKFITKNNQDKIDDVTQKTLSRVFTRALLERWTPVNSLTGYPACENETVLFSISADEKIITWASFRPGVTEKALGEGAHPTQEASFKVVKASEVDGWDTVIVKPDPKPLSGFGIQVWEIREGTMKITLKEKEDSAETTKGSYLAMCH